MIDDGRSGPIPLQLVDADADTRLLIETLLRTHTGRDYRVSEAPSPAEALRASEAQLAAVVADRERLERQFYQAQKMETVGQLAGGIAHDFNNILTAIVGFGTLVAEQVSENEPASRNAAEILAAANRASALTRQLLAFGRRQVLHPTRLDLNETVNGLAVHAAPADWREHRPPDRLRARSAVDPRGSEPARIGAGEPGRQRARRHAEGRHA